MAYNVHYKKAGFGLSELLIAMAAAGGIILVLLQVFSTFHKETKKLNIGGNVSEVRFAVNKAIGNVEGCEETFVTPGNVNPEGAGTSVDKIFFKKGSLAFQKNDSIGQVGSSHSVSITEMVLQNYMPGASNRGLADFRVTIQPKDQKAYTQKFTVGVVLKNGIVVGCVNVGEPTIDCVGDWGKCSKECGGGTQEFLISTYPKNGGVECSNKDKEIRFCNTNICGSWVTSAWGSCSGGNWAWVYGEWGKCELKQEPAGDWSQCSEHNCGESGTQIRQLKCAYTASQTRTATCSATSASGMQTRTVTCKRDGIDVPDSECAGEKPADFQSCDPTGSGSCGEKGIVSQTCTPALGSGNAVCNSFETRSCQNSWCKNPEDVPVGINCTCVDFVLGGGCRRTICD